MGGQGGKWALPVDKKTGQVDVGKVARDDPKTALAKLVEKTKAEGANQWQTAVNAAFAQENVLEFLG